MEKNQLIIIIFYSAVILLNIVGFLIYFLGDFNKDYPNTDNLDAVRLFALIIISGVTGMLILKVIQLLITL